MQESKIDRRGIQSQGVQLQGHNRRQRRIENNADLSVVGSQRRESEMLEPVLQPSSGSRTQPSTSQTGAKNPRSSVVPSQTKVYNYTDTSHNNNNSIENNQTAVSQRAKAHASMQVAKKEFSDQIKQKFRDKLKTSGQLRHILAQEK